MDLPPQRRSDVTADSIAKAAGGAYSLDASLARHALPAVFHLGDLSEKGHRWPVQRSDAVEIQIERGRFVAHSEAYPRDRLHPTRQGASGAQYRFPIQQKRRNQNRADGRFRHARISARGAGEPDMKQRPGRQRMEGQSRSRQQHTEECRHHELMSERKLFRWPALLNTAQN